VDCRLLNGAFDESAKRAFTSPSPGRRLRSSGAEFGAPIGEISSIRRPPSLYLLLVSANRGFRTMIHLHQFVCLNRRNWRGGQARGVVGRRGNPVSQVETRFEFSSVPVAGCCSVLERGLNGAYEDDVIDGAERREGGPLDGRPRVSRRVPGAAAGHTRPRRQPARPLRDCPPGAGRSPASRRVGYAPPPRRLSAVGRRGVLSQDLELPARHRTAVQ
jgi:hypothetical protein